MKFVFTSYAGTPEYNQPESWLKRIEAYTGILESLAKDHEVIGIERINYEGKYEQNGVHYFFLRQIKRTVYFPRRIHQLIKKLEPDVVFINGFIFPFQIIQLRLKLGKRVKIIVLHRSEKPFTGIKRYLQKLADKCVNTYLFSSDEFGKQWMKKGIISDSKKIHEVMPASSMFESSGKEAARGSLSLGGSQIYLWVGRLDANKDPITVVKAFKNFLQYQPSASLHMIYHSEELLPEIEKLSDKVNIYLIGKMKHDDLLYWYNSADFFISGSHYEGGGIAACEAMSCGCIPVLTNIFSFRRMTGPGKCGLLYEPGNEKELLDCLLKTKEMNIEAESKNALQQFKKELSFEAIAGKINTLLSSL